MYKNNFNTNKDGHDIELYCVYDCDLSRMYFEKNFIMMQYSGYGEIAKAYYIDHGNVPAQDSIEFSVKGLKKDILGFCKTEIHHYYEDSELNKMTKDELAEIVLEGLANEYGTPSVMDYQEINEYYFKDTQIEIIPDRRIVCVSIRGYSQGDYAEVFYSPDDIKDCWGKEPSESEIQKICERLFYDAPIYARFYIDGEEYHYFDYVEDEYEWEPQIFIEGVAKDSGVSEEELKSFVPKYPGY